ncbi:hypothetical protein KAJ27_21055 [bacterium]|nr:hypothetical protein [bacterium]
MKKRVVFYFIFFITGFFLSASKLDYTSEYFLQGFQLKTLPPIMKKYLLPGKNIIPGSKTLFHKRSFNIWDQNNEKLKNYRNEKLYKSREKLKETKFHNRKIRMKPKREYEDLFNNYDELRPEVKSLMDGNSNFVKVRQR